ncbi:cupin domain-containing protein [Glaciecola sp. 1036]|uniref:cupin domain-containing protein n=1 Tax=Alteromonadaceae TaxID=72275 RepID=UPI003CFD20F5
MKTNPLDSKLFLAEYWQQKPLVIRGFIQLFNDPIDEHDLAGLAQEEEIDARIVRRFNGQWKVFQGPFETFDDKCKGDWTLLVQGVDKYIDQVKALFELVSFLPAWRTDDVMISYSVKNAGVGAHIDQYDVFIIQGKGKRRWKVGAKGEHAPFSPTENLSLVNDFEPIIDEVLLPGDAIYIPPQFPHSGVTIEDSLNYSIGFRAPSFTELLHEVTDQAIASELAVPRYQDNKSLLNRQHPFHAVTPAEIQELKAYLTSQINSSAFDDVLMRAISQSHLPETDEEDYTLEDLMECVNDAQSLYLSPGVKPIFLTDEDSTLSRFYINCVAFDVASEHQSLVQDLIHDGYLNMNPELEDIICQNEALQSLLLGLLNLGYIYIEDQ